MAQRYYSSTAQPMSLTSGINASALTIGVNATAGLPSSTPFTLVIDDGKPTEEIITVTAVSGFALTVVRGEDGSPAQSHTAGAEVRHMMTARDLREPQQHIAAPMDVHGVGSGNAVLGTATAQVVTNKTLSGLNNTFSNIPQSAIVGLGTSLTAVQTSVTAEASSRAAADTTLQTNINLEATARAAADAALIPPGTILLTAASAIPSGWLVCDGSEVSRSTYANLFAAVGTTYGAGNGSTTFVLPNLKGRVAVGQDTSQSEFNTLGETGGEKTHTLTIAEMPSHRHDIATKPSTTGAVTRNEVGMGDNSTGTGGLGTSAIKVEGGDGAHNNLQPYIALSYIIRF